MEPYRTIAFEHFSQKYVLWKITCPYSVLTFFTKYRVSQKKKRFEIVFIFAPKIIFKVTPILLDIQLPYIKVILSQFWGLCHYRLVFYGYFSFRGLSYFWLNDRILTWKWEFAYSCKITKNVFRRLGRVAMSHTLLVLEVMNEKQTYLNMNFKFRSGP